MFHTPPINPEHLDLSRTATLESYGETKIEPEKPMAVAAENAITPKTSPNMETEAQGSEDFVPTPPTLEYTRELTLVQLPDPLSKMIDDFLADLLAPKYAKPLTTDQVAGLFQNFYIKFEAASLAHVRAQHDHSAIIHKIHTDYVERMEAQLCGLRAIFPKIFQNSVEDLKVQLAVSEKARALRCIGVTMAELGAHFGEGFNEKEFVNKLEAVEKHFNRCNHVRSPLEKLVIVHSALVDLMALVRQWKQGPVDADFALPVFIFFVVHRNVENLYLNFRYIRRFRNKQFWSRSGEMAYDVTTLEALVTFVLGLDCKRDLGIEDVLLRVVRPESVPSTSNIDSDPKQDKTAKSEKRRLSDKLAAFNTDGGELFISQAEPKDILTILQPQEFSTEEHHHPTKTRGRRTSLLAILRNAVQELLSHYEEEAPGLVMGVADQGMRSLSLVLDLLMKFLGTKIVQSGSPQRSRSGSVNSFARNRLNSTLGSLFGKPNDDKDQEHPGHPLNKLMRWRGSTLSVLSPSVQSFAELKTEDGDATERESITGSIGSKKGAEKGVIVDGKAYHKIEKEFDRLSIAELRGALESYNSLLSALEKGK